MARATAAAGKLTGKAHRYGANLDTDQMIPARYLVSTDPAFLAQHAMETADPGFVQRVQEGDILVAESNLGCGSSREHAPIALKGAGIRAMVAGSYARIFYRNSINQGLPPLECPEAVESIETGDELEIDLSTGSISNLTRGTSFSAKPVEPFVMDIINAGGVVEYTRQRLREQGRIS